MDAAEIAAGPLLDRLVAERVMGAAFSKDGTWFLDHALAARRLAEADESGLGWEHWAPSTNIAHAWEVVERMNSTLANAYVTIRGNVEGWVCEAEWREGDADALASTAPLAICRAALAAVGA